MTDIDLPLRAVPPVRGQPSPPGSPALWEAAQALEAQFLAEMLQAAGLGDAPGGFGGGPGEQQFASLLVHEQANALTRAGGIGLSEMIFETLKEREHEQG